MREGPASRVSLRHRRLRGSAGVRRGSLTPALSRGERGPEGEPPAAALPPVIPAKAGIQARQASASHRSPARRGALTPALSRGERGPEGEAPAAALPSRHSGESRNPGTPGHRLAPQPGTTRRPHPHPLPRGEGAGGGASRGPPSPPVIPAKAGIQARQAIASHRSPARHGAVDAGSALQSCVAPAALSGSAGVRRGSLTPALSRGERGPEGTGPRSARGYAKVASRRSSYQPSQAAPGSSTISPGSGTPPPPRLKALGMQVCGSIETTGASGGV